MITIEDEKVDISIGNQELIESMALLKDLQDFCLKQTLQDDGKQETAKALKVAIEAMTAFYCEHFSEDCDKQASVLVWHEINEDDDSTFPDDDRHVLVTFENFDSVIIGRFDRDDDGGGTWRIGDIDEPLVDHGLFVNGWWELPKREDKPNVE